jgi:hypothetical protein
MMPGSGAISIFLMRPLITVRAVFDAAPTTVIARFSSDKIRLRN